MNFYWFEMFFVGICLIILSCIYGKWEAGYFKRRGIKNLPYRFPIIGNMLKTFLRQEHYMDTIYKTYSAFPNEKYVGFMQINKPAIIIRNLELLKQITIKDFEHFFDHEMNVDEHADPLFANNLAALKGDKWRDMRSTLSPAFTSSKMKNMFTFIDDIGKQMSNYYLKQMNEPENKERGLVEIEMKDAFTRYSNDVIASTAFGLVVNSLEDQDNEFYKMGKVASNFSPFQFIKFFLFAAFPSIMKYTGVTLFSEKTRSFFRSLVLDTMKNREKHGIIRPDMIQLLMDARKGSLKYEPARGESKDAGFATAEESNVGKQLVKRNWTENEIVAQAVVFFIAGFETAATLLCFIAHELTVNTDVQRKLQNEIDNLIEEKGFTLDYNDLMKMKYLDMVVTETLRLWPPAVATDRRCMRPYELPPPNDLTKKGYTVQPGEGVWIPIHAIHHDPQYYPEPEKFDPERFSDENKSKINPLAYLPFGIGPRNCIGSRFALMETKGILFNLLAKFDFEMTAKTENPIKLSYKTFNPQSDNGFWIGLKPRDT